MWGSARCQRDVVQSIIDWIINSFTLSDHFYVCNYLNISCCYVVSTRLLFSLARRQQTGDYLRLNSPPVNWRTRDVQERRDLRPLATQRPSQAQIATRGRSDVLSGGLVCLLDDLRASFSYLEAPLINLRVPPLPVNHHEVQKEHKRHFDCAGVRTDRPERSYQELFSAAKEMTIDTL